MQSTRHFYIHYLTWIYHLYLSPKMKTLISPYKERGEWICFRSHNWFSVEMEISFSGSQNLFPVLYSLLFCPHLLSSWKSSSMLRYHLGYTWGSLYCFGNQTRINCMQWKHFNLCYHSGLQCSFSIKSR